MSKTNEIRQSRVSPEVRAQARHDVGMHGGFRKRLKALTLACVTAATSLSVAIAPGTAHAETVSPDGKGVVGGAFLGGEIVVFGEALFGVRSTPAYLIGAGAGAVAGGVGGYFIEQAVDDGRVPAYMLAGGLALLIPAIVVALDQTRYLPSEGAREDRPVNAPTPDPGKPGGSAVIGAEPAPITPAPGTTPGPENGTTPTPAPAPTTTPVMPPAGGGGGGTQGPQSLINLRSGGFYVGVPVPEVRPVFTAAQAKALLVQNTGSELRFPVVHVQF